MPGVSVLFVFGGTSGLILEHASIQGVKWPSQMTRGCAYESASEAGDRFWEWGWAPKSLQSNQDFFKTNEGW